MTSDRLHSTTEDGVMREDVTTEYGAESKNERVMETGSYLQLVLRLALPAMIVIIVMVLYNLADTFFIGQMGNPEKIAAISVCMPVFTVLSGIGTLFGIGGGTAVSIALGEKNRQQIGEITAFCCMGTLLVGTVYGFLTGLFAEPLCRILGAEESFLADAERYLKIFAFSSPFVLFSTAHGSILRSDGEAATAMLANLGGTLLNIVLDALFILGLHMDVAGAAAATVIGNVFSAVLVLLLLLKKKQVFLPHRQNLHFRREVVVPVLTLGLPMTFSTILGSVSNAVQNRMMVAHDSVFLTAQSVAGKLGLIITMLIMGFCMGLQPAVSYNFGSKNYKRMYEILRKTAAFTLTAGTLLALCVYLNRARLVAAFIQDEGVIRYGQIFVLANICVAPVYAVYQTFQTFLQATGKADYAIIVSLLDKGLVFLPVLAVMNRLYGAYGIAFSHAATMILSVIIAGGLTMLWSRTLRSSSA